MRVTLLDPPAFTPPYDDALAAALAAAGAEVVLRTGPFRHGALPVPRGYRRVVVPRARHPVAMLGGLGDADVRHLQWFPLPEADQLLVRRLRRPWVVTAHDVLPREPRRGQLAAQRRLLRGADAVVVHTAHGRERLAALGVEATTIPHGVLRLPPPGRLPPELRDDGSPVALLFGLLRPYKGLDVLFEAWRGITGAQLWVAGAPRMELPPAPPGAQLVTRFVADEEAAALLARADLVVLPYRAIEQSGVLFAALGLGRPLLLSAVGGFPEVAAAGAAELVPPGDPVALHAALARLLGDPVVRERLAAGARAAAAGPYAWPSIARAHLALYARVQS